VLAGGRSIAPSIIEPAGIELGVPYGVLEAAMAEILLQCADIHTLVGQFEVAAVAAVPRLAA
jgi:hypothetical protein